MRVASVFTDNAVLQQGISVPVWGRGAEGSTVTVEFAGSTVRTVADSDGKWMVRLPPMKADSTPRRMTVAGQDGGVTFENIVVGEVWFASGQSNMDFRVGWGIKDMDRELAAADYPDIRFFATKQVQLSQPAEDTGSSWYVCDPETVKGYSAVAYFFARDLHLDRNVPVGVIQSAYGATGIESWMSLERLGTHPAYKEPVAKYNPDPENWKQRVEQAAENDRARGIIADTCRAGVRAGVPELSFDDREWKKVAYPVVAENMGYSGYWGMIWVRKTFGIPHSSLARGGKIRIFLPVGATGDRVYLNGEQVAQSLSWAAEKVITLPAGKFKTDCNVLSVNMFVTWGVGGIGGTNTPCYVETPDGKHIDLTTGVWTHNNTIEPPLPGCQDYFNTISVNYNAMVAPVIPYGIRGFLWYQGEANSLDAQRYAELQPMLIDDWRVRWGLGYLPFLYVQLANYGIRQVDPPGRDAWAEFRDAQTTTLERSINTGMACAIDIGEESDIHPKNKQDVGHRLYLIAKAKIYDPDSDIEYSGPVFRGAKMDNGMVRISLDHAAGLRFIRQGSVSGFALAGADGKFIPADGRIECAEVVLETDKVKQPVRVRYAWGCNPEAPLYNGVGLPAVPFNEEIK